jgi:hypothetical protein
MRCAGALCLPKISSLQFRQVEVDREVPDVVVVGDHFGTAAWQVVPLEYPIEWLTCAFRQQA